MPDAWRAAGSGAPVGNRNAFKHGLYTAEARQMRALIRRLSRATKALIDEV
jgi:hypothetical protein